MADENMGGGEDEDVFHDAAADDVVTVDDVDDVHVNLHVDGVGGEGEGTRGFDDDGGAGVSVGVDVLGQHEDDGEQVRTGDGTATDGTVHVQDSAAAADGTVQDEAAATTYNATTTAATTTAATTTTTTTGPDDGSANPTTAAGKGGRKGRPRRRDPRAPKPPRTAFELFQQHTRRILNLSQQHGPGKTAAAATAAADAATTTTTTTTMNDDGAANAAAADVAVAVAVVEVGVPPAAPTTTHPPPRPPNVAQYHHHLYDGLDVRQRQEWRVKEAADELRYRRQLLAYRPSSGYDECGEPSMEGAGGGHPGDDNEDDDEDDDDDAGTGEGGSASKSPSSSSPPSKRKGRRTDGAEKDDEDCAAAAAAKRPRIGSPDGRVGTAKAAARRTAAAAAAASAPPTAPLTLQTATFNDMVVQLVQYHMEKGHCRVPTKKGGMLGKWVDKIRKEYKHRYKPLLVPAAAATTTTTAATKANEEEEVKGRTTDVGGDDNKTVGNNSGVETKNSAGNSAVDDGAYDNNATNDNSTATTETPTKFATAAAATTTATTTTTTMASHDNLRLDAHRVAILTHVGMVWEFPNEDYEEIWQNHFRELLRFKEHNGHCNVPQKGHGKLSWWVKIQRELYINTTTDQTSLNPRVRPRQTMPQHRIRQLESIGFEWRVRPLALKWETRYHELLDYKNQFGDCNVPQNFPPNRVLGKWVMKQRGFYYDRIRGRKSPLTPDRQEMLEGAGFCWVAPHVAKTKAKLPMREDIVTAQQQSMREQREHQIREAENGDEDDDDDDDAMTESISQQERQTHLQHDSRRTVEQDHLLVQHRFPTQQEQQQQHLHRYPNDPHHHQQQQMQQQQQHHFHHPSTMMDQAAMHHHAAAAAVATAAHGHLLHHAVQAQQLHDQQPHHVGLYLPSGTTPDGVTAAEAQSYLYAPEGTQQQLQMQQQQQQQHLQLQQLHLQQEPQPHDRDYFTM